MSGLCRQRCPTWASTQAQHSTYPTRLTFGKEKPRDSFQKEGGRLHGCEQMLISHTPSHRDLWCWRNWSGREEKQNSAQSKGGGLVCLFVCLFQWPETAAAY